MVSTLNSSSFRSTSVGFLSRSIQRFPKINYGPEELESLFTERSIASLSSPLMIKRHHGLPELSTVQPLALPKLVSVSRNLGGFDLVPCSAAPALQIRKHFAFLSVKARMHLTPPLLLHYRGVYTRGSSSGGAGHLTRETRALDSLRPLLNLVFVAAAMQRHHLAGACPDLVHH